MLFFHERENEFVMLEHDLLAKCCLNKILYTSILLVKSIDLANLFYCLTLRNLILALVIATFKVSLKVSKDTRSLMKLFPQKEKKIYKKKLYQFSKQSNS